ncbi:unnamed protein product [Symbiodinium sp. CCMP2456]|nr:unnamed protein product [Symbiodinium sp. CCMP2456]
MLELYFFTDRATTKDVVLLPALCHDIALFSIALQLVLLVLILLYLLFKALLERVVMMSRARSAELEEAAQEQEPKSRIELQPPSKCLQFGIKWDPDLRYMISTLKAEGEEGLTRFLENQVFVWKLRSYIRNKVSKAFKMSIKRDMIRLRQQRQLRERTAQKTPEQETQDRHALLELFGPAHQPATAAQTPLVQEQAPVIQEAPEQPAASVGPSVVEEEAEKPDPFLKMLIATSQRKLLDPRMSPADAAAGSSMKPERPPSSWTKIPQPELQPMEAETSEAFGQVLIEASRNKPIDAHMSPGDVVATASITGEKIPHEAPQTAAMACMMTAKQPVETEAPFGCPTLFETSQTRRLDAQLSPEDAAALACLMAEELVSNSETHAEVPSAAGSSCDTDGWEGEDFFAHIDPSLPPELAAVKLFAAMGISEDLMLGRFAPVTHTNTMESEDPFKDFWDDLDGNMSPELVAANLVNRARSIRAY